MSRYIILVHGDSDGVCSGALIYAYLMSNGVKPEVYFTHPYGLLEDIEKFTKNGDHIYIADIALSEAHLDQLLKVLKERSTHGEVIYIDHHPEPLSIRVKDIPVNTIVHDNCCSASELTYRFLEKHGLTYEYSRVALYGAIGDYIDDTPWVKNTLNNWDKRSIYLEAGILIQGLEGSRREHDFKRRIVDLLAKNMLPSSDPELLLRAYVQSRKDEELRIWVKNNVKTHGIVGYVANPPGSIGRAANYARIYSGKPIGLAYEERGDMLVMSLRSSPGIDLNTLLRRATRELGGSGGGHPSAAGARIKRDKFIELLDLITKMTSTILVENSPLDHNISKHR